RDGEVVDLRAAGAPEEHDGSELRGRSDNCNVSGAATPEPYWLRRDADVLVVLAGRDGDDRVRRGCVDRVLDRRPRPRAGAVARSHIRAIDEFGGLVDRDGSPRRVATGGELEALRLTGNGKQAAKHASAGSTARQPPIPSASKPAPQRGPMGTQVLSASSRSSAPQWCTFVAGGDSSLEQPERATENP